MVLTLQRHLKNILFYHKGLRGRKTPLPFVACARKATILRGQIWSAHESDVVGLKHLGYQPNSVGHLSACFQQYGQALPSTISMPSPTVVFYLSDEIFAIQAPILGTIEP